MREFQDRRRAKGWFYSKPILVLLLILVGLAANASWQMYRRYRFTVVEKEKAEANLAALEAKRANLAAAVAMVETEAGLERLVREKFAVARDGEYVVTVIDKTKEAPATTTTKKRWWQKLFDW